jgi:hypothetical protein
VRWPVGEARDAIATCATKLTIGDMVRGALTFRDPKYYLFFTKTEAGGSVARQFLKRLKERTKMRPTPASADKVPDPLEGDGIHRSRPRRARSKR